MAVLCSAYEIRQLTVTGWYFRILTTDLELGPNSSLDYSDPCYRKRSTFERGVQAIRRGRRRLQRPWRPLGLGKGVLDGRSRLAWRHYSGLM